MKVRVPIVFTVTIGTGCINLGWIDKAGVHFVNEEAYLAAPARKYFIKFPYVTKLPEQDRVDLMDPQKYCVLFGDPDIKYTMVQRRCEATLIVTGMSTTVPF
ncbi:hypothetical protein BJ741DRAFT_664210 [Chytriomyces cf. hyalinus JEL632]|nr:hypothetical protein BJ741DRAFT_664210 [Chytriomyces cf. hyalinus JEL632]